MRKADAIIVSSPAYNLLPTGPMIRFLNKLHASGDYREVVHKNSKIGAAFSLGGTDWTNFTLNVCKMAAMELVGSYDAIVDAAHFDFVPDVAAVLLEDDMLSRIHKLGENVADALLAKEKGGHFADAGAPGACPDCHGNLLEIRADGVYCPQCLTKAKLHLDGSTLTAEFTEEERAKNRWSPWGRNCTTTISERATKKPPNMRTPSGNAAKNTSLTSAPQSFLSFSRNRKGKDR